MITIKYCLKYLADLPGKAFVSRVDCLHVRSSLVITDSMQLFRTRSIVPLTV